MRNLSDIQEVKRILSRHGFHFSKSLGQNFLIDPEVCPRMAEESGITKDMGVIEVGPGFGVLTQQLALRAGKVVAIEVDKRLPEVLADTLSDFDNVTVYNADVMELDLNELIAREFPGMDVVVCANLPYYITSPVIMKLLEEKLPIRSLVVMVQKEAAVRICAQPGQRECGAVSVAVQYYAEPEILFAVGRDSFFPAPKVDSAVMKLDVRSAPPAVLDGVEEKRFFQVVHAAFSQRRKTVSNSLSSGLSLGKEQVRKALSSAGIPENFRAEQLTLAQFGKLCQELNRQEAEK
ncbi:MAG: 16S rRNA (adenine(1518)-N(6)/adenine(1519)-N(6))-dimethyltransferase RsmA [Oscillospiraceae bacterium]|nr:16S rRNA (adenine(1518)-N(6)/adenine(1519)-N(6))-dimethyltransferase RsmA [Oscillospiraceae bacterium]